MSKDRYHFLVNVDDYQVTRVYYRDEYSITYLVKNKKTSEFLLAYVAACEPFDETKSIKIYKKACDEIDAMIHFQHPSFLKLIGFSPIDFQHENRITVFTEYYGENYGKLFEYYKKKFNVDNYTNTSRQILLIGIARGLMLLHKTNFLHIFLNPENIYFDKKSQTSFRSNIFFKIFEWWFNFWWYFTPYCLCCTRSCKHIQIYTKIWCLLIRHDNVFDNN